VGAERGAKDDHLRVLPRHATPPLGLVVTVSMEEAAAHGLERWKEGIERRELTCGTKGIFDISRDFYLLSNRKLLF
jgi:hypothetical protein